MIGNLRSTVEKLGTKVDIPSEVPGHHTDCPTERTSMDSICWRGRRGHDGHRQARDGLVPPFVLDGSWDIQ
eukprot:1324830-Pyramimonas_sp.AAC.1